ncbi:hypothetical protein ACFOOK_30785 [Micromonospora krabiensis]|uniref:Uncharacterized protein n=1 Tax=Micromonospora krabiensis TaxID=307121 RepID=A0A1C3N352_9ACTN|nr:hypothetical protein [Micromonospora krabiensis]SBV27014.1 hypothetical protein GA0070620_2513 [Micromonospora krabiensis]
MTADSDPSAPAGRQPTPTGISVAVGWAVMIAAALLAAAVFSPTELPGRVLVMAVAAGVFASMVADLRAVATVTGLGMATYVGFLANRFGDLTATADAWTYALVIGLAGVLGSGYRFMRSIQRSTDDEPVPGAGVRTFTCGPDPVVSPPDNSPFGNSRGA